MYNDMLHGLPWKRDTFAKDLVSFATRVQQLPVNGPGEFQRNLPATKFHVLAISGNGGASLLGEVTQIRHASFSSIERECRPYVNYNFAVIVVKLVAPKLRNIRTWVSARRKLCPVSPSRSTREIIGTAMPGEKISDVWRAWSQNFFSNKKTKRRRNSHYNLGKYKSNVMNLL